MAISIDSQAIILLCSRLGLSSDSEVKSFTLKEWNPLAKALNSSSLRPADLFEMEDQQLQESLNLSDEVAGRIVHLLQRSGSLAIELERLEGLGIRSLTRADSDYPERYRQRLKESAPPVLFYAGEKALLGQPGIAVVGSRHLDAAGTACAEFVGNACGRSGLVLYSGGAKGVDTLSMRAALDARGTAVGILADSLEKSIRDPENRAALSRGDLCLATPVSPNAPFSVGTAMGRNKLIYTLADYAIVVASDAGKGGTWTGAIEALRSRWLPLFVLNHSEMPDGNKLLLSKGALAFPHPFTENHLTLRQWLEDQSAQIDPSPFQPGLF